MSGAREYDVIVLGAGLAGSFAAMHLASRGRRVALVDRGPASVEAAEKAAPPITFPERINEGVVEARNHVVGGNSTYWGGALVRQRKGELADMLLLDQDAEEALAPHHAAAEIAAGLPSPTRRFVVEREGQALDMCELFVLPGRRRNLARRFLKEAAATRKLDLYPSLQPQALDRRPDGSIASVVIGNGRGLQQRLCGQSVVLSMGVVDSILFADRFRKELDVPPSAPLGKRLHDHLSIPLFEVEARPGCAFYREQAPAFSGPFIVGRRIEVRDERTEWRASGFLHFQCIFDEAEPYRTIKRLMDLRQRGFDLLEAARMLPACAASLPSIARIGLHKVLLGRLYISPRVRVVATLDFESFPSPENTIALSRNETGVEEAEMRWDVREIDIASFTHLYEKARAMVELLSRHYGLNVRPAEPLASAGSPEEYFASRAKDAYHLGGGLQVGKNQADSLCGPDLRWHGTPNLHVLTTGAFRRPGSANPVLTLLALAHWLSQRL